MVNLDDFNNLGALMTPSKKSREAYSIQIALIDEDPKQPRTSENPGFSEESIAELAQTIKERGVKSPISVREDGNGRYIINHGARRYRASKYAGLESIPAVIDNDYSKLDQVIENIQRNNLTSNEIASFISEELLSGKKKTEIADELGKSNAWVSQYAALLTMPEEIALCWEVGVMGDDVTVVAEICKSYKKNPELTTKFLQKDKLTRKDAASLKEMIEHNETIKNEDDEGKSRNITKNSEENNEDSLISLYGSKNTDYKDGNNEDEECYPDEIKEDDFEDINQEDLFEDLELDKVIEVVRDFNFEKLKDVLSKQEIYALEYCCRLVVKK